MNRKKHHTFLMQLINNLFILILYSDIIITSKTLNLSRNPIVCNCMMSLFYFLLLLLLIFYRVSSLVLCLREIVCSKQIEIVCVRE